MPSQPSPTPVTHPLLEVRNHYHRYLDDFLARGRQYPVAEEAVYLAYRRALIAWYEVHILEGNHQLPGTEPYLAEVFTFFLTHKGAEVLAVDLPFAPAAHPLAELLPRPVSLDERQKLMLEQFDELGESCRDLLLLIYYHRLPAASIAELLEIPGGIYGMEEKRTNCLFLVRERLRNSRLYPEELSLTERQEELLDRYLRQQLSREESGELDNLRQEDASFAEALQRRGEWAEVVRIAGRRQLHKWLEEERQRHRPRRRVQRLVQRARQPSLTGAVLLVVVAALFLWWWYSGPDYERLARQYFSPYPNVISDATDYGTTPDFVDKLFVPYEQEEWSRAYDEFFSVAPDLPFARFYLGVTALAQRNPGRAADWLEQIGAQSGFYEAGQWYLALAYLADGQIKLAQPLLLRISEIRGHPFRRQARELLTELG